MMKRLLLILLSIVLAGCAAHQPLVVEQVTVNGKVKTYVSGKYPVGVMGDEVSIIDRYDENGNLAHPADISTTGTVHDTMKAAAGSTGTAALVTPVVTPIVNNIAGTPAK